jgi:uncharacterized repeat protein (TIGR01451 family)
VNVAALLVFAALVGSAPGPLSVDVAASRSNVQTGDTVSLTIVVRDDEDPPPTAARVRIDQRLPPSLRYVSGTDGAVVSNTLVQWVVSIGPAHSGSVSATYTVTSDSPSGEMKLSTTACPIQDDTPPNSTPQISTAPGGDSAAPAACQTTSLEVTDPSVSARRSSLFGAGTGWPAALAVAVAATVCGAVVWAGNRRRYQRKSLVRRTKTHN